MALGNVRNTVQSGGGAAGGGAEIQARTVIALGVSPGGTPAELLSFSSSAGVRSALGVGGPLAEYLAKLIQHKAPVVYCVPLTPSAVGAKGAVTHGGTGAGTCVVTLAPHKKITVLCTTSGALGTCVFRFSLDDGVTYGPLVPSVAGATWVYRVPGTFTSLTFNAASYVATKTLTVAVTGTVTDGAAWVGVVTQASSPLDNYDVLVTVVTGGALAIAVVSPSLDGGKSTLPNIALPTGGVVVLPNTGLVLTFASTFVADDTYSFLCAPPGYSTTDVDDALDALALDANAPAVALVHLLGLPANAAGAISAASTLQTQIDTLASERQRFYQGLVECPSAEADDTVVSGGAAIVDTADTDTVIRAAREGQTFNYVNVFVGTNRMPSALSSSQLRRPSGWAIAARYVEADPRADVSEVGRGALDVTEIGRDEFVSSTSLHDAQLNVLRTYPNRPGAYLAIEAAGVGWRNMTIDGSFQDAGAVRVLLLLLAAITVAGQKYLGSRQPTNADGTIAEGPRQGISADLDATAKRSTGLLANGAFREAQASTATATVLATSQLGAAPRRLDVEYTLQPLGLISDVSQDVFFSGVLSVS